MRQEWWSIDKVARQQHGVVTRAQLKEHGFSEARVRTALRQRRLIPVFRSVYVLFGAQITWEARAHAATLVAGPDSALCRQSAAAVYGLDGVSNSHVIHISVPRGRSARGTSGISIHRPKKSFLVQKFKGLPVTSIERTVFDLAKELPPASLEALLDSAHLKAPGFGEELLKTCKALKKGHRGMRRLTTMLAERVGSKTESPLEQQVAQKLRAFGIRQWVEQQRVKDKKGFVSRVDFAWPKEKVVLHVDSYRWHSSRARFDLDAEQRSRLEAEGWAAQMITSTIAKNDEWMVRLAALLEKRSARPEQELERMRKP